MGTLMDLSSKVNIIHPALATMLGFCTTKIDVGIQKIDRSYLNPFKIAIVDCLVKSKLGKIQFFYMNFLLANISLEIVLEMPFLTFSKANIRFAEQKLVWRTYTATEALSTTRRVEIIDKKEFAAMALNTDNETFMMHVTALAWSKTMPIHPSCQA